MKANSLYLRTFVWILHQCAGLIHSALRVVVGLYCETVLVDGAVALARDVEDAAQLNVAPDLDPLRIAIAAQRIAERVSRRLVIALHEENFANPITGERTGLIGVQRLLILRQRSGHVSLRDHLLTAQYGDANGKVGRALQ